MCHESDMGLAIIGINTGPERNHSGTAFFSYRRLNFETGNVRSLPDDGNSAGAHECGSRAIVRLREDAPVEDRLGACSHLAEITARMDRPQTVRALHLCVLGRGVRNSSWVVPQRGHGEFEPVFPVHRTRAARAAWCRFADPFRLKRDWVHVHKLPARQRRRTLR